MKMNFDEYYDETLPGCISKLISTDNYIEFRNSQIQRLSVELPPGEAVKAYELIVDNCPSELIDAREYVLNELQYEIRRSKLRDSQNIFEEEEKIIIEQWAANHISSADVDETLDLVIKLKEQRQLRKGKLAGFMRNPK